MKYTYFSFLFLFFLSFTGFTQPNYFIYFQTENRQQFYVKLGSKMFNSSSAGYLIVPKLKEGDYTITYGFPKNEWPEKKVTFKVNKDAGYILKNFEEKGWGLFNLQSFEIIRPGDDVTNINKPENVSKDDAFSNMIATVVNDSTIRQKDIVVEKVKEIPVSETADSTQMLNTLKEKNAGADLEEKVIPAETSTIAFATDSKISRSLLQNNHDGIEMIYTDEANDKKDTIRIFMPVKLSNEGKEVEERKEVNEVEVTGISNQTDSNKTVPSPSQDEPVIEQQTADTTKYVFIEDKKDSVSAKSPAINSNCNGYANEEDFLKLRKKMAAENKDEEMIKVAKKSFKSKCFTTEYIKNLSALFLSDDSKYNFFDASYPFVSDSGLFYTLESLLSDAYYVNRFKAMIHH